MKRASACSQQMAAKIVADRRVKLFQHTGWQSEYAPDLRCAHARAREVVNEEPIEHPDPLPDHWFPIRIRHWVCAGCGAAVTPSAFQADELIPLPKEHWAAWWNQWRTYERRTNAARDLAFPLADPACGPEVTL